MLDTKFVLRCLLGSAALVMPFATIAQETASPVVLDTVILGGKREIETETATPVTRIDQAEIDDRQAGTIGELIDTVPGVTLMNGSTPGGSGINIRGFGANGTYGTDQMVLIQVDGATQGSEELYRLGTQLYTDPSLYKDVSVTRGTVGTFEYGSGVIGGMVQLRTKDASDFIDGVPGYALRQTVEGTTNGDGLTSSTILAWQPSEDVEFLGQYVWRRQDVQTDGNGDDTGAEPFKLPSYLLKGKFSFGAARDQSLTLSYNDTQTRESDVPYDQFGLGSGMFGNVDRDIRTRSVVLAYAYDPDSPLIDLEANLSYSDQKIDSSYIEGSSPLGPLAAPLGDADHRYQTTKLTVKNTARFQTGAAAHELRLGAEVIRRERAEAYSAPGGTDHRFALFAVDDISHGGWTFSPALRYETQKLRRDGDATTALATKYSNDAVMGGLSVRYAWQNGFSVFGSAAYTENLPILDDFETPDYMGRSQKARVYELGAGYEGKGLVAAGDALAVKVNIYHTDVWNMTTYSGVDQVKLKGLEIEASYGMADGYYVDLNGTISRGDEVLMTGARDYWENLPADNLRLTLGKRWGDQLDLSWEAVASASMDRVNEAADESGGQVIHNLRATYRPQDGVMKGTELRVGVENLFDKPYQPWLATRNAPGRNLKLTIAKTF